MSAESSYRWWEFYLVRYFVGTVCGTVIVLFLVLNPESTIHRIIIENIPLQNQAADSNVSKASVTDQKTQEKSSINLKQNDEKQKQPGIPWEPIHLWVYGLVGLAYCYIASGPILFLHAVRGWLTEEKGIYKYYSKLSKKRAKRNDSKVVKEYVESYKHLREHGNAFLIVFFELLLGMILFFSSLIGIIIAILIWVALAASVWVIGTYLETKLKNIPDYY